jgi:hypothetical protein
MEAIILKLAKRMPVLQVGNLLRENDTRLWRVIHHYVGEARSTEDFSDIVEIGLEEFAGEQLVPFAGEKSRERLHRKQRIVQNVTFISM